jgi:hypothetical protein
MDMVVHGLGPWRMDEKKKRDKNSGHGLAIHHREIIEHYISSGIVSSAMLETIQNTGKPQNHRPPTA